MISAARCFTLSQVLPVTGLDSPIPRAEILVCRDTFGDQVINNRLSTALGQTLVVSVRTDAVGVTQNNYGTVFRIRLLSWLYSYPEQPDLPVSGLLC